MSYPGDLPRRRLLVGAPWEPSTQPRELLPTRSQNREASAVVVVTGPGKVAGTESGAHARGAVGRRQTYHLLRVLGWVAAVILAAVLAVTMVAAINTMVAPLVVPDLPASIT